MTATASARPVRIETAGGVAHLVLDAPGRSANVMDDAYGAAMDDAVRYLDALVRERRTEVRGVLIRSAKRTFFAGGDLDAMVARPRTHEAWRWRLDQVQRPLRLLEALPVPVVAAVNGAAVGGGLEVALAAHARIASTGSYPIGLPEVRLGVLAAGGGISRSVRLLGLRTAVDQVLLPGALVDPDAACRLGLIDRVADGDVVAAALAAMADLPRRRLRIGAEDGRWLPAVRARVEHGVADAPRALLAAAVAGVGQPRERAQAHEVAAFLDLVTRPQFGLTLQAAYGDRQAVLRSIPRESATTPAPGAVGFGILTATGTALPATRFGPDLRRGIVEVVVPPDADAADVADARRQVRAWGGCPVVARGSSCVAALTAALRDEVLRVRRDGVPPEVVRSALVRLGIEPEVAGASSGPAEHAEPSGLMSVGDVADRLACAVSLAALAALAGPGNPGHVATVAEANLASVAGLGFPEALGGALGHVLHHVVEGADVGVAGFARTADRLARHHGDHLALRPALRNLADQLADQPAHQPARQPAHQEETL